MCGEAVYAWTTTGTSFYGGTTQHSHQQQKIRNVVWLLLEQFADRKQLSLSVLYKPTERGHEPTIHIQGHFLLSRISNLGTY